MQISNRLGCRMRAFGSTAILALVLASPSALAENPADTEKPNIDSRVREDRDAIRPRGDYPPAQADKGTVEQHAEAIDEDALTPDQPADAGVDDLNQQQHQQSAAAGSGDAPKVYDEQHPPAQGKES